MARPAADERQHRPRRQTRGGDGGGQGQKGLRGGLAKESKKFSYPPVNRGSYPMQCWGFKGYDTQIAYFASKHGLRV